MNAVRVCILSFQVSQTKATETTGKLAPKWTQNLLHLVCFWKSAVVPEQMPDNRRTFATPDNRMTPLGRKKRGKEKRQRDFNAGNRADVGKEI